ncbi:MULTISPECIES: type I-E CRISPR-associated protein Cas7/Cse4/CasC [Aerococcus]|uniref:type I-E CRISPR-associated protein Cas7/Cse4/CasC n=1 Tax=Aerococcus TaxID=1375 RepID=UPI0018A78E34|nr:MULTISPECIES: type I-E CRISPR-associated protein Cas7/Cse4/CasC [Aerococcus]MCY3035526.1 type I-E CRISPR-associated protein Cas7/Cse4/CasC [Aerococcus sp. Group 2]MCY3041102.1 type I-E CRISPR-associated protein Cas7/Cse4/CasC [Aerococcus sp. Group 2]MCY3042340.1 type I-E CRISPR-associated protein Cas7/Cse4/CasC [Aerococcus sp. Group 2]MDK6521360.1 type I-E CRISPR-associated protein Cas7/Cse4/CasC [Aerococcus urinae]
MKNNERIFVDIHAIQTVPPSNINRDDTGSPKTAQYGGVRRARVSSQSWKRAMREYFYENSVQSHVGIRTLQIVRYLADKIQILDETMDDETAMKLADETINKAGIKTVAPKGSKNKGHKQAKALFFLGDTQANELAQAAVDGVTDKKVLQNILKENLPIDIALFGRMVAGESPLNEDASSQVAHAISTHAVRPEFDFFTAVDDLAPEDNAGAGMIGTIEYNSSTLYRYANVAVHELSRQLNNPQATLNTLKLFIESFTKSMPTGKINTFANQTLPQALLVTVRDDRPVNLVSAFEKPVKTQEGYVEQSIEQLFSEYHKVEKIIDQPLKTFYLVLDDQNINCDEGKQEDSLSQLLNDFDNFVGPLIEKVQDQGDA